MALDRRTVCANEGKIVKMNVILNDIYDKTNYIQAKKLRLKSGNHALVKCRLVESRMCYNSCKLSLIEAGRDLLFCEDIHHFEQEHKVFDR